MLVVLFLGCNNFQEYSPRKVETKVVISPWACKKLEKPSQAPQSKAFSHNIEQALSKTMKVRKLSGIF